MLILRASSFVHQVQDSTGTLEVVLPVGDALLPGALLSLQLHPATAVLLLAPRSWQSESTELEKKKKATSKQERCRVGQICRWIRDWPKAPQVPVAKFKTNKKDPNHLG